MSTKGQLALFAVAALGIAGCGEKMPADAERVKQTNNMIQLSTAYHGYQESERRPPKSHKELGKKVILLPGTEEVDVAWGAWVGAKCKDGPAAEVVLGHRSDPLGDGVLALFCDGKVKLLTQQEFEAAKKATPAAK